MNAPTIGFRTRWQDLPPGWQWVLWGIGAAILGAPAALAAASGRAWQAPELLVQSLVEGLPWLGAYVLILFSGPARPKVLIVLGWTGLVAGLLLPAMRTPCICSTRTSCVNNLKQIGLALRLYEQRETRLPDGEGIAFLGRLYQADDEPALRVFLCPQVKGLGAPSILLPPATPGGTAVRFVSDYVPNPAMIAGLKAGTWGDAPNPSLMPIVWERKPFYAKGSIRCVLFQDGSAQAMQETAFQALLTKSGK